MSSVEATLRLIPELNVETVESSCCGMAGAFGYGTETFDISTQMGELSLLPAVRAANSDAIIASIVPRSDCAWRRARCIACRAGFTTGFA